MAALKITRVLRASGPALRVSQARCAARPVPSPCVALWGGPTPGHARSGGASWARLGVRGPSLPVRYSSLRAAALPEKRGGSRPKFAARAAHVLPRGAPPCAQPQNRRASTDSVPQTRGGGGDGGSRPPRAGGGGGGGDGSGGGSSSGGFWAAYMAVLDRCAASCVAAVVSCNADTVLSNCFLTQRRALLATRSRSSPSPPAASTCWATSSARRVRCSHVHVWSACPLCWTTPPETRVRRVGSSSLRTALSMSAAPPSSRRWAAF